MKNKIIAYLRKQAKSDKGASTTIEFLFVIILLFMFTMSVIDLGLYFNNRMIVTNAAQNGARLVSVYGGSSADSSIAKQYGQDKLDITKHPECANVQTPVECSVATALKGSENATVNLQIKGISCGPDKTTDLGMRTYCTITWDFPGVPGSSLSFFRNKASAQNGYVTTETSNAEVINK